MKCFVVYSNCTSNLKIVCTIMEFYSHVVKSDDTHCVRVQNKKRRVCYVLCSDTKPVIADVIFLYLFLRYCTACLVLEGFIKVGELAGGGCW